MKFKTVHFAHILLIFAFTFSIHSENDLPSHKITERELLSRTVYHDDFVMNAIPKCGTHLLMSCLRYMINKPVDEGYDGIKQMKFYSRQADYLTFLQSLKGQPYIHKTHVPYFPEMEKMLLDTNIKQVFIIRDPRDAIVSLIFYLEGFTSTTRDFMKLNSEYYNKLSINEKINAVMTGECCTNYVKSFLKPLSGWTRSSYSHTVKYEDIVGPKGGGSKINQLQAIRQIADYLHVTLSDEEIEAIAEYSVKTGSTQKALGYEYPKSQIGSWKMFFDDSNKFHFKMMFGHELIQLGYEKDHNW